MEIYGLGNKRFCPGYFNQSLFNLQGTEATWKRWNVGTHVGKRIKRKPLHTLELRRGSRDTENKQKKKVTYTSHSLIQAIHDLSRRPSFYFSRPISFVTCKSSVYFDTLTSGSYPSWPWQSRHYLWYVQHSLFTPNVEFPWDGQLMFPIPKKMSFMNIKPLEG